MERLDRLSEVRIPWRTVVSALLTSMTVAAPLAIAGLAGHPVAGGS